MRVIGRPPWYLLAPLAVSVASVALPLFYLISHVGLSGERLFLTEMTLNRLARTLALSGGVVGVTVFWGTALAWLAACADLKGRRILTVLIALPLAIPGYVHAYAWLSLGGDDGVLVRWLGSDSSLLKFFFERPDDGRFHVPRLSGYLGALLALSICNLPYIFLPARAALKDRDPCLEEAARGLGRRAWAVQLSVVGPQIVPALLAGALLVALHVTSDFAVVSLFRYDTLSAGLYSSYGAFDLEGASHIALWLVLLAAVLLTLEFLVLANSRLDPVGPGAPRRRPPVRLGPFQGPCLGLAWISTVLGTVIPAATAIYWMGGTSDSGWTRLGSSLWASVQASLPAAVFATAAAFPIAILAARYPSRTTEFLTRLPFIGYAAPALAFALSLIMLCTARWIPDLVFKTLYQSMPLLVFAYTFHFLAEAVGPLRAGFRVANPRLEEAARSLGSGPAAVFLKVTLPLLRRGALVAVALVFLSCMKELPLTILLSPVGFETLARRAWDHVENVEFAKAAPYALGILGTSAAFVGCLLIPARRMGANP